MSERVIRWAQGTQTQLTLYEDNSKISLQRQAAAFVLGAQLTEPPPQPFTPAYLDAPGVQQPEPL